MPAKRPEDFVNNTMHYLDHNATSPLRPEARDAVMHALANGGNASSVHGLGRAARAIVEKAREQVAALAGARAQDVVFTSSGSEANWLALKGAVQGAAEAEARITRLFVSAIEHDCVRANAMSAAEHTAGIRLEFLPVTRSGLVDMSALRDCLREGKGRALVAVMAANNETGVIQPLGEVARIAREAGALLLVDAVQAAGKMALDGIGALADYLTLSAHKIAGPQGAGAVVVKEDAPFAAQMLGGGQERGRRAGTENVSGIAGFGAAAAAALRDLSKLSPMLRDDFELRLKAAVSDVVILGEDAPRLGNTSNFAIPGMAAETAIMALDLDGVMISSGAACSSGKVHASHVLAAMSVPPGVASSALRVSFGWNSTEQDVEACVRSIGNLAARVRARAAAE